MIIEPRRRKSSSVTFTIPDDHYHQQYYPRRASSFAESEWDYEPTITSVNPHTLAMVRALRSVKTFKKSWDSDKALKSTYEGKFPKHQLRAFIFLALGYAIVAAWLGEMPAFALLPPKSINCTPIYLNVSNRTVANSPFLNSTSTSSRNLTRIGSRNSPRKLSNVTSRRSGQMRKGEATYNYSREYGRSVLTDFNVLCDPARLKLPYIVYLVGLTLGGLIFGNMADHSGRKMILLGSMWAACGLSVFQLLSEDYISYVFFILFVGLAIGAVQVITVPYVIEMFSIESRAIYGLSLTAAVFLLDLIIPGLAFGIKNWKILQGVVTAPLIITAVLYWISEESMFWYTAQKDYVAAVLSLTRIAHFNGIVFEDMFREARDFLRGKRSKGIQCDFQPLMRLEEIQLLTAKYPYIDMGDIQATSKKASLTQRISQVLSGHHYHPTLSTFYPTDFFHSSILSIYLLVMCGLWLVSSLTEYSLDASHLTMHLTDNFFLNYFYTHVIQIASFIVAFPMVYKWGRRWPTFCFFLIAEVCLLGSVTVRLDAEEARAGMLIVYFMGKFASRGGFIVLLLYTCEIFPTGLRCTTLGICYTFRLIGIALASPDVAGLNGRMPRLIYGILSLILGSMALLLPETKKFPLPRTIVQVEVIPTSISKKFRRQRSAAANKQKLRPDGTRPEGANAFNDGASSVSGIRSVRFGPYDNQSTLHSVYELQECGPDDTVQSSASGRYSRRMDLRNPSLFQPYSGGNVEAYRQQTPIAEDAEYDEDVDDDRTRYAQQQRLTGHQKRLSGQQTPNRRSDGDIMNVPTTPTNRQSSNDIPSQLEMTAQIQAGELTGDRNGITTATSTDDDIGDETKQDEDSSQTPAHIVDETTTFPPNISEEENYFSEHC